MKSAIRLIILIATVLYSQISFSQSIERKNDTNNVINAYNEFGCDIFNQISLRNDASHNTFNKSKENIFISPLSFALNMAMVYNGAENETETAIAKSLHISGIKSEDLNQKSKELIDYLSSRRGPNQINIANSLWLSESKRWEFKDTFIKVVDKFYYAKAFRGLNSDKINHWINDKTNGRISNIDFELDDLSAAIILNTIYFNGKWAYPFHVPRTEEKDFYLCNGKTKRIEMMRQVDRYKYHENSEFQEVEIMFKDNFGMIIFLPKDDKCFKHRNVEKLYEEFLNRRKWISNGYLEIPKFQLKFETEGKNILSDLGMHVAFDTTKADFTGMAYFKPQDNLYIEEVIHSTFLKINEMGAEAAAATFTHLKGGGTSPPKFRMVVNKPFYLVIRNTKNNAILFIGAIYDPQKI